MAKPAGVTAVTLPGDIQFSVGGVRTEHLIGAFVKSIDGNGLVVMQDAQGREFVYPTRLGSSPIAIFTGAGQPRDQRIGDPIIRPLIDGATRSDINQRFPFDPAVQQVEFGGADLGVRFLSSADAPADADLFGNESVVPEGCIAFVPEGLWDFDVYMVLGITSDVYHRVNVHKVMPGQGTDRGIADGGGYGSLVSSYIPWHYERSVGDYYYIVGEGVDSAREAGASYFWIFRYLGA